QTLFSPLGHDDSQSGIRQPRRIGGRWKVEQVAAAGRGQVLLFFSRLAFGVVLDIRMITTKLVFAWCGLAGPHIREDDTGIVAAPVASHKFGSLWGSNAAQQCLVCKLRADCRLRQLLKVGSGEGLTW